MVRMLVSVNAKGHKMVKAAAKKPAATEQIKSIQITRVKSERLWLKVIGESPLIYNSVPEKARQVLLAPGPRMTDADKVANLKHDPMSEYRNSVYRNEADDGPTRLQLLSSMFKGAMRTAALEMPGVTKAGIGRLIYVENQRTHLYGTPQFFMSVVRSADAGRTPDIRTRAIVARWCAEVTISFITPNLRSKSVIDLLEAAGMISGVGDFRQEKGAGDFGRFRIVTDAKDEAEWNEIAASGGRAEQDDALESPTFYDSDSERLMTWFMEEMGRRGRRSELKSKKQVDEEIEDLEEVVA